MIFSMKALLSILILILVAPALAGEKHERDCKLLGSWIGYDAGGAAWWTTTADGQNAAKGTLNLEAPGSVLFLPGAAAVTEMRGSWVKTGWNTYDWTVVGFSYDAYATTVGLARLSGKDTMSEDCDTVLVSNVVLEYFYPDADLNNDEPYATANFPDHAGYRIQLYRPELP